ncbi:MAG: hypothetical protein U0794_14895 [Isosphaeraceae bacterium]
MLAPATGSATLLVRDAGQGAFREVRLPTVVGAPPVGWLDQLLLPGGDGRLPRRSALGCRDGRAVRSAVRSEQARAGGPWFHSEMKPSPWLTTWGASAG